jgi:hypothetical protein
MYIYIYISVDELETALRACNRHKVSRVLYTELYNSIILGH